MGCIPIDLRASSGAGGAGGAALHDLAFSGGGMWDSYDELEALPLFSGGASQAYLSRPRLLSRRLCPLLGGASHRGASPGGGGSLDGGEPQLALLHTSTGSGLADAAANAGGTSGGPGALASSESTIRTLRGQVRQLQALNAELFEMASHATLGVAGAGAPGQ